MSEQVPPETSDVGDGANDASTLRGHQPATGVAAVDRVLADLDQLDDLPLEEHLGVFERAHSSLRAALDAEPDASA